MAAAADSDHLKATEIFRYSIRPVKADRNVSLVEDQVAENVSNKCFSYEEK
jgi:hypothetical protein